MGTSVNLVGGSSESVGYPRDSKQAIRDIR